MTDSRNAAAIHNVFYGNLNSRVTDANEISQLIYKLDTKNTIGQIVKEYNLNQSRPQNKSISFYHL